MAVAATALCSALSRLTFSSAPPPSFLSSSLGTTLHFSTFRGKTRTPSFVCSDSGYNVQIVVGEAEPEEALLRRFRREVSRAGIIDECKRRRFFENKQDEKKRKAREAGRRNRRRRQSSPRFSSSSTEDDSAGSKKKADDDDDNWELPEGDIPA
ncbi:30S ribosomal protein S21, chloroplastic-like isoform X1 [Nymphaea colorata]|nr:30S ribosomal protein S21, chloroplastic-like isoform X1 [Nymphaea colorata]